VRNIFFVSLLEGNICKLNSGRERRKCWQQHIYRPTCLQIHTSVSYILRYSIFRTASYELRTALAFVIVSLSIASCLPLVSQNSFHFIFFYTILTYYYCLSMKKTYSHNTNVLTTVTCFSL
jgi:hypothetical protein